MLLALFLLGFDPAAQVPERIDAERVPLVQITGGLVTDDLRLPFDLTALSGDGELAGDESALDAVTQSIADFLRREAELAAAAANRHSATGDATGTGKAPDASDQGVSAAGPPPGAAP